METSLIVMAWLGGIASGLSLAIGLIGLITGRMPFNPARIDWSVGEARALGAIVTVEGFVWALLTLVLVLVDIGGLPPPWLLPFPVVAALGGTVAIWTVGHRHDARNPSKRYWR